MQSIWSGYIGFGLVNIPVKLYSPAAKEELEFHLLHKKDFSPIHYVRICAKEGKEVQYQDLVHGYQLKKGFVPLSDEDFRKANPKKSQTIDILDFVDEGQVDAIYFEKPFFLEPDGAPKAYAILREALKKSKKVGVAKFVLRNREHLALVKPVKNLIVLEQLRYKSEIREPKFSLPGAELASKKELQMALKLINQYTSDFKPESYRDTYIAELKDLIRKKSKGHKVLPKGEVPVPTHIDDLMKRLKESLSRESKRKALAK